MNKSPVIDVKNLSFAYQDTFVLKDASFHIDAGEFVGIIGPNGGGKTTLLKLLMGFLKPTEGMIQVFNHSPTQVQQRLAYVPQSMRFDRQFPISALDVVLLGKLSQLTWYGRYRHKDKVAACEALEKVGLLAFKDHAFGALSGGQAQRVLIARALVSNPELLLLDEPTASVDAHAESEIYTLLQNLKGTMTIVMVTHDLKAATDYVQKVICVQRSVATLTPKDVCEHFAMGLYHPPLINMTKKL
jgi:zinc transport system ATP-binding protein